MGIAVSSAEERQSPTWVAGIAEVTVDPKTGRYKINRLTIAMDPGTVINPLGAKAQIQGAALWGASQVMSERLTLKNGAFEQSNFHDYTADPPGGCAADRCGADPVRAITRAASASPRPRLWRRRSPTRSTTLSAYACGICRSRQRRFWQA